MAIQARFKAKAKLDIWTINGIEFEAKALYDPEYAGALPQGIVRDPNDDQLFFFSKASFAATELDQLIEEGYLVFFYPPWVRGGVFCVRLALDSQHNFYLVGGSPDIAHCIICTRAFPFIDNGDNMIMTAPATGPSYACGGDPAEWDSACTECIETGPEEEEPPEDWDGLYDDERGR